MSGENSSTSVSETETDSVSKIDSHMEMTWKCILAQYQTKAAACAKEFGAGISCFIMLESPKRETNCKFCYGERNDEAEGPWKTFVLNAPNRKTFLDKYDPRENYAICVSVPATDSVIANIRLFKFDTGVEIELPDKDPLESPE